MLSIGPLTLQSRLVLAPLSGISDLPFRMINKSFGCELAFVEMINARSMSYKSKKTKQMLSTAKNDRPLGVQLIGCEPRYILRSLEILNSYEFDLLDFNAACPAKKVTRRGEGASLLKNPKKFSSLVSLIVKNSRLPVSVKIRTGWNSQTVNSKDIALAAQDAGARALFVHGRTREQYYSGTVDYAAIREVKQNVRIPVIASGDILSPVLAQHMLNETNCDGLLIARGALGNPWIFPQITAALAGKEIKENFRYSIKKLIEIMTDHLESCVNFYGEKIGVMRFRKFYVWYTKGIDNVRPLRQKSSLAKTKKAMEGLIHSIASLNKESVHV